MAKATIRDVANLAGVSIATVSRVVNRTGTVNSEMTDRVERAARELNYSPNNIARSLKTNNTSTIAFLFSNIADPFFTTIGKGIERYVRSKGFVLVFCGTESSARLEANYLHTLVNKQIDGIIINSTGKNDDLICQISHSIPLVLSNRRILSNDFKGDFIDMDNADGTAMLTRHLLALGHTKIGAIIGPRYLSTAYERYNGYVVTMTAAGIEINNEFPYVTEQTFDWDGGYKGAKTLMESSSPPTAIIAMNSEMALGAMHYLRKHNLNVPGDVSLASFGDIKNRNLYYTQPTIVSADLESLGHKMGELLIERITVPDLPANREIRFQTVFMPGSSTAAAPQRD